MFHQRMKKKQVIGLGAFEFQFIILMSVITICPANVEIIGYVLTAQYGMDSIAQKTVN